MLIEIGKKNMKESLRHRRKIGSGVGTVEGVRWHIESWNPGPREMK